MEAMLFGSLVLLIVVVFPLTALAVVASMVHYKFSRRRLAHEWEGFDDWAERVHVTPAPRRDGDPWKGTIELGGVCFDVSVDVDAFAPRRATPATLTLRSPLVERAPEDLHVLLDGRWVTPWRPPSLHRRFAVRGEEIGALAFLKHGFCRTLNDTVTHKPAWHDVEITGRMMKFAWTDMFELIGDKGEERTRHLFAYIALVMLELPERYDAPALLAERAADAREPDEVRWRAGRALFKTFWKTPELEAFVANASQMNEEAQMMCALWGVYLDVDLTDDARFDLLVRARKIKAVASDADHALTSEYGWRALMDARLPEAIRLRAAKRALTSPGAPSESYLIDAALSELILSDASDTPRGDALLGPLMTGGWRPDERAALELARSGSDRLKKSFVKQIQRFGVREGDAQALAALANAGVSGARELLESLRGGAAHGMLSLSVDEATRGGLSPSEGSGGLTAFEDDP